MKKLDVEEMSIVSGAGAFADAIRNNAEYKSFLEGLDILRKNAQAANDQLTENSINNGQAIVDSLIDKIDSALSC